MIKKNAFIFSSLALLATSSLCLARGDFQPADYVESDAAALQQVQTMVELEQFHQERELDQLKSKLKGEIKIEDFAKTDAEFEAQTEEAIKRSLVTFDQDANNRWFEEQQKNQEQVAEQKALWDIFAKAEDNNPVNKPNNDAPKGQKNGLKGQKNVVNGQKPAQNGQKNVQNGQKPAQNGQKPAQNGQKPGKLNLNPEFVAKMDNIFNINPKGIPANKLNINLKNNQANQDASQKVTFKPTTMKIGTPPQAPKGILKKNGAQKNLPNNKKVTFDLKGTPNKVKIDPIKIDLPKQNVPQQNGPKQNAPKQNAPKNTVLTFADKIKVDPIKGAQLQIGPVTFDAKDDPFVKNQTKQNVHHQNMQKLKADLNQKVQQVN
jgi:hypothetical protein